MALLRHPWLHLGRRQLGVGTRHFHIRIKGQRHTHAAFGDALGFAKPTQTGILLADARWAGMFMAEVSFCAKV